MSDMEHMHGEMEEDGRMERWMENRHRQRRKISRQLAWVSLQVLPVQFFPSSTRRQGRLTGEGGEGARGRGGEGRGEGRRGEAYCVCSTCFCLTTRKRIWKTQKFLTHRQTLDIVRHLNKCISSGMQSMSL